MKVRTPFEIADREGRRLAQVMREIGGEGAPLGSVWMACDIPGSWATYAAGVGVDGPVLDRFVAFYKGRGRVPEIQVTPYQHETLLCGLEARGFTTFETVTILFRPLDTLPEPVDIEGLRFRKVDPENEEDIAAFRDSQMRGFFAANSPPDGILPITDRVARGPRSTVWLLELNGRIVGSGGLETFEESGVLIAGCVQPEARGLGLHSAFIRFRLERAAERGLEYVTVGSLTNGPTERNALRAGFSVAFTQLGLRLIESTS